MPEFWKSLFLLPPPSPPLSVAQDFVDKESQAELAKPIKNKITPSIEMMDFPVPKNPLAETFPDVLVAPKTQQGGGYGARANSFAGVPDDLQPQYGGRYYPVDYADRVRAAAEPKELPTDELVDPLDASEMRAYKSRISPEQANALLTKHAAWQKNTLEGQMQEAEQIKLGGMQKQADLYVSGQEATAQALEKSTEAEEQAEARAQTEQAKFDKYREVFAAEQQRRIGDMEKLSTDLQSTKVDPDRYMKNMSAGATFLSILGIALGGFNEGFSEGKVKNRALEMMNKAIERDIDAQKTDISTKQASLSNMRGLYAMARERFGDERAATDYTRARLYEHAAKVTQGYVSRAKTVQARNAGLAAVADLETQRAAADNRARQSVLLQVQLEAQRRAAMAASAVATAEKARREARKEAREDLKDKLAVAKFGLEERKVESEFGRTDIEQQRKYDERLVISENALAPNAKIALEYNEAVADHAKLREILTKAKNLRVEGSGDIPLTVAIAKYEALLAEAHQITNKEVGGVYDRGNKELIQKELPEATFWSRDKNTAAKFDVVLNTLDNDLALRRKATALRPLPAGYAAPSASSKQTALDTSPVDPATVALRYTK